MAHEGTCWRGSSRLYCFRIDNRKTTCIFYACETSGPLVQKSPILVVTKVEFLKRSGVFVIVSSVYVI